MTGEREQTFDQFYRARFASLSRLAFLLVGSSSRADELAQDACEQVFRRWDEIDQPAAYARVAVVNGARSAGRRRRLADRTPGDIAPDMELGADAIAVRSVLADLPERERDVVVLRYYADLKLADIADHLDLPLGTVKSHLHRALRRMEAALTEDDRS